MIERDVEDFASHEGVASVANVWRYGRFPGEWRGGRASEEAQDSTQRSEMIETRAGKAAAPFEWVKAPILNAMTRLAIEADPAKGTLISMGYEEALGEEDIALAATLLLTWESGS